MDVNTADRFISDLDVASLDVLRDVTANWFTAAITEYIPNVIGNSVVFLGPVYLRDMLSK